MDAEDVTGTVEVWAQNLVTPACPYRRDWGQAAGDAERVSGLFFRAPGWLAFTARLSAALIF
jgi:hypothetical protein